MLKRYFSKRAHILKDVLGFIDARDWERHGDCLVFGKTAFEQQFIPLPEALDPGDMSMDRALRDIVSITKKSRGQAVAARKTSVVPAALPPHTDKEIGKTMSKHFDSKLPRRSIASLRTNSLTNSKRLRPGRLNSPKLTSLFRRVLPCRARSPRHIVVIYMASQWLRPCCAELFWNRPS